MTLLKSWSSRHLSITKGTNLRQSTLSVLHPHLIFLPSTRECRKSDLRWSVRYVGSSICRIWRNDTGFVYDKQKILPVGLDYEDIFSQTFPWLQSFERIVL